MQNLSPHLQKYIVEQDQSRYTPIDQACWRYILRQLQSILKIHAHQSYQEGLEKTGISVERIPLISEISKKLEAFGWRALPVSGFIPPAAFMELQAHGVLPIAADMRSIEHLTYTPAPDIVHEAAGHAPMLVNPEFASYLRSYAEVARKAIISKEDVDLYTAIRNLSDLKENPRSTERQITAAQRVLKTLLKNISHVSEAGELSRMNWWTAEYGLIGPMENPKIYGAGLLSSAAEAKLCMDSKVKKIPLSIKCTDQGYDITEPQPQLFVAPDFKYLKRILEDMAERMAYRRGGRYGLEKAVEAKTVNTVQLNSGIQISGQVCELISDKSQVPIYFKTIGPTQLCFKNKELPDHDKTAHRDGFSCAVGGIKGSDKCLSDFSKKDFQMLGLIIGQKCDLEFLSGIQIKGQLQSITSQEGKNLILSFVECTVLSTKGEILFDPSWGIYDLALGNTVVSVFGGPADRLAYGENEDFVAQQIPQAVYSKQALKLHELYTKIRKARESGETGAALIQLIKTTEGALRADFKKEWLLRIEMVELLTKVDPKSVLLKQIIEALHELADNFPDKHDVISEGLNLAQSG